MLLVRPMISVSINCLKICVYNLTKHLGKDIPLFQTFLLYLRWVGCVFMRPDMPNLQRPASDANCGCLETRVESKNSAKLCLAKMFGGGGGAGRDWDNCGSTSFGLIQYMRSTFNNMPSRLFCILPKNNIYGMKMFGLQGLFSLRNEYWTNTTACQLHQK